MKMVLFAVLILAACSPRPPICPPPNPPPCENGNSPICVLIPHTCDYACTCPEP